MDYDRIVEDFEKKNGVKVLYSDDVMLGFRTILMRKGKYEVRESIDRADLTTDPFISPLLQGIYKKLQSNIKESGDSDII